MKEEGAPIAFTKAFSLFSFLFLFLFPLSLSPHPHRVLTCSSRPRNVSSCARRCSSLPAGHASSLSIFLSLSPPPPRSRLLQSPAERVELRPQVLEAAPGHAVAQRAVALARRAAALQPLRTGGEGGEGVGGRERGDERVAVGGAPCVLPTSPPALILENHAKKRRRCTAAAGSRSPGCPDDGAWRVTARLPADTARAAKRGCRECQ